MVAPKIPKNFLTGGSVLNINITMQGWDQLVQAEQAVQTQFINQSLDPGIANLNNYLFFKMKEKMHYWMGKRKAGRPHMRDVTKEIKRGVAQYTVNVPVPYALRENRRFGSKAGYGPHQFAEPAVQLTIQHIPIFAAETQRWINAQFAKVQAPRF